MSIADGRQNRAENAPFMATPSYLDKIIYARDKICLNLKATRQPRPVFRARRAETYRQRRQRLLHGHALCKVARLIGVAAEYYRRAVGDKLQRNYRNEGRKAAFARGHLYEKFGALP